MAGWAGFTDEDLKRMKQGSTDERDFVVKKNAHLKRPRPPSREKLAKSAGTQGQIPLDPSQKLSVSEEPKVNGQKLPPSKPKSEKSVTFAPDTNVEKGVEENKTDKNQVKEDKVETAARELDENEAMSLELDNIAKFQKQQKMIEEANKQKKEYLAKAITERKKKAKAESEKLTKIQVELSRLDTLLSVDVGVIRDRIEAASMDYMEAQRRYAKAEEEFINSKMNLFAKGEMKERLTEHLYTIIHQNEVRKANKLAELMKELQMEVEQDELELAAQPIPVLTNFNSVTTLPNPAHKSPVGSPEAGKTVSLEVKPEQGSVSDSQKSCQNQGVSLQNSVPGEANDSENGNLQGSEPADTHSRGDNSCSTVGESLQKNDEQTANIESSLQTAEIEKQNSDSNRKAENHSKEVDANANSCVKSQNVVS